MTRVLATFSIVANWLGKFSPLELSLHRWILTSKLVHILISQEDKFINLSKPNIYSSSQRILCYKQTPVHKRIFLLKHNVFSPQLQSLLMKHKFISHSEFVQMELDVRLRHSGSNNPLRWSPMWCLSQRLRCQSQYKEFMIIECKNN